jgi:hypothetical protein
MGMMYVLVWAVRLDIGAFGVTLNLGCDICLFLIGV